MVFLAGDTTTIARSVERDLKLNEYLAKYNISASKRFLDETAPIRDNWPYLYLLEPSIPVLFYFLAALLALLWWRSWTTLSKIHKPLINENPRLISLELAALGAGFMLIEAFGISKGAVLFGSTWQVNTVVVSGVLLMVLGANFLASKLPNIPRIYIYPLILLATAVLYQFPYEYLFTFDTLTRAGVYGLLAPLPLFFSGYCFARAYTDSNNRSAALGVNLFGALIGGMVQLSSYAFGIRSAVLFAGVAYLLAAIARMLHDQGRGFQSVSRTQNP